MTTFEDLSERRRKYIDAARDNGFEEGLRKLLADLYPDNAHFIFELLQNAEDAGASEVTFELQSDGLKVEHDGTRLFDLPDIESITGIRQSTKPDDETTIGKFGVGFKSVFGYTQSPVIHSGEFSFSIQNLFMPIRVPADARPGKTTFWFPFDRPDKPAEVAVKEVGKALRDIASSTLLFLNSIQIIGCFLHDGSERLLQRRQLDENVIEIASVHEEDGTTYWYRSTRDVVVGEKSLPIAVAFSLQSGTENKSKKRFKVQPIDGQVFIYFPAENESSGLKFHVHAPFASTVARDSVRDDPGNSELVEGLASLVADSLPDMCQRGLNTDGLLAALPNNLDDIPELFEVVREHVVAAFGSNALTPKAGGGHAPSELLIRADAHVRTVLDVTDAQLLLDMAEAVDDESLLGWLPSRDGRAGNLLDSLYVHPFGRTELAAALERIAELDGQRKVDQDAAVSAVGPWMDDMAIWEAWIRNKSDSWLREFYLLLEEFTHKSRMPSNPADEDGRKYLAALRSAPLFRVQSKRGVEHVGSTSAYLPVAPGLRRDGLLVDHLAVFEDSVDQSTLRFFYDLAKVKTWDAAAQLDKSFQSYTRESAELTDQHVDDLKTLARLIAEKKVSPHSYKYKRAFLTTHSNGKRFWVSASSIFLDLPYLSTGLSSFYGSEEFEESPDTFLRRKYCLDPGYLDKDLDISSLVIQLGARDTLEVERVSVRHNSSFQRGWVDRENKNKEDSDWDIPSLNIITSVGDETLLRELWRVVTTSPHMYADAIYRAHGSARRYSMPSQLLVKLQSEPWILDRDGNLRLPEDTTESELAQGLDLPKNSHLLERSGFARKAKANADRRQEQSVVAKELGFDSVDDIKRLGEMRSLNPHKFKELFEDFEAAQKLPEASTSVPERRGKRAGDVAAEASLRRYERKVRSVYIQVPGHLSDARGYLQTHYTNDDRIMFCQVCNMPMPFKINGQFYFEAVQFVSDSRHELHENRLALCPTCAAKYRHARETTREDIRDDLLTQEIGDKGSVSVDVVLAGEAAKVRFVGKHAIDLQAALASTMSVVPDDEEDE